MSSIPSTMRSWLQTARGAPADILQLKEDTPVPKLAKGQVLVKVNSVALNPVGYKIMGMAPWPVVKLPNIPESDFSGTIVDANGAGSFKAGDEILGTVGLGAKFNKGHGAMAEYIAVDASQVTSKPSDIPYNQAAGLIIVGLTAFQCLSVPGYDLKPGQSVFINGGSTSVGQIAIQIAKLKGAGEIGASCSKENEKLVKGLGADHTFDYRASPLAEQLKRERQGKPYDLIVDTVGAPELFKPSNVYLKPAGAFITIASDYSNFLSTGLAMTRPWFLGGTSRAYKFVGMQYNEDQLKQLTGWMSKGQLNVPIDGVYKSDRESVMKAYERMMSHRAKGKIIVEMQ